MMTATGIPRTVPELLALLASEGPVEVVMHEAPSGAKVVATRNNYRAGCAFIVLAGGRRYAIGGSKRLTTRELTCLQQEGIRYIQRHQL